MSKEVGDGYAGSGLEEALRSAGVLPRDLHATREIPTHRGVPAVPAEQVRRGAEWSLGDELLVVSSINDIAFESPKR